MRNVKTTTVSFRFCLRVQRKFQCFITSNIEHYYTLRHQLYFRWYFEHRQTQAYMHIYFVCTSKDVKVLPLPTKWKNCWKTKNGRMGFPTFQKQMGEVSSPQTHLEKTHGSPLPAPISRCPHPYMKKRALKFPFLASWNCCLPFPGPCKQQCLQCLCKQYLPQDLKAGSSGDLGSKLTGKVWFAIMSKWSNGQVPMLPKTFL